MRSGYVVSDRPRERKGGMVEGRLSELSHDIYLTQCTAVGVLARLDRTTRRQKITAGPKRKK